MTYPGSKNADAYSGDIEIPEVVVDSPGTEHSNGGEPTLTGYYVTAIGDNAFYACAELTSLKIPDTVTSIGNFACMACSGLRSVTLGNSVASIGMEAFYSCRSITEIISFNPEPPIFTADPPPALNGFNATLFVPVGSKTAYLEANAGNDYSTWNPTATYSCISKIKEFMEVDLQVTEKYLNDCYATFYSEKPFYTKYNNFSLTNDLQCSSASVSDGTLTMNWEYGNNNSILRPDVVPGGTAVVLKGYQGTHYPVIYDAEDDEGVSVSDAPENNMLLGSEVDTLTYGRDENQSYIFYMLSYSGKNGSVYEDIGFYYGAADGAAFTSKANKAWLPVPNDGSGAKITSFVFGYDAGETTAIRTVDSSKPAADVIYNLQGIRVNDMNREGIYIVNGKKVIKK